MIDKHSDESNVNNPDITDELADVLPDTADASELDSVRTELQSCKEDLDWYISHFKKHNSELRDISERQKKEIAQTQKFALEKFLLEMLPVLDSFDGALEYNKHSDNNKGLTMTYELLYTVFEKFGMHTIEVIRGSTLNPEEHEAIKLEENRNYDNDLILYCIQKGYKLNGRVVRPARVCISRNTH